MYLDTNETIFPDGYQRERIFNSTGDMVSPVAAPTQGFWARLAARFTHWRMRRAGRLVLRDLSDDQLRDIGISRAEAESEVSKSFFFD